MDDFPQFSSPCFPTELQTLIWEIAVSDAPRRIIELTRVTSNYLSDTANAEQEHVYSYSNAPIPPLLHACKASRALAMKRWVLAFQTNRTYYGYLPYEPPIARLWFDFESDILMFVNPTAMVPDVMGFYDTFKDLPLEDKLKVRNLALNLDDVVVEGTVNPMFIYFPATNWEDDPAGFDFVETATEIHDFFPNIRTLYILLGSDSKPYGFEFVSDWTMPERPGYAMAEQIMKKHWEDERWGEGKLDIEFKELVEKLPTTEKAKST